MAIGKTNIICQIGSKVMLLISPLGVRGSYNSELRANLVYSKFQANQNYIVKPGHKNQSKTKHVIVTISSIFTHNVIALSF